jgi:shikimate dehydrogenase
MEQADRIDFINQGSVFHLGLTGWPVAHSLSPRLHRAALASAGLQGEYSLFPVENHPGCEVELGQLVDRIRAGELNGLNVTIPHKQRILPLLDELSDAARAIGAVNTIYYRDSKVWGDNTDADGFLYDLRRLGFIPSESEKTALVLGAGGAARAVVYALLRDGWQVIVSARRFEQAEELTLSLGSGGSFCKAELLEHATAFHTYRLVVNATPAGMAPHPEQAPWPEGVAFPEDACIYDLIYSPLQTRLVREAVRAGLRAANGLGMLIEQAALAFELWTGHLADRVAMKAAVE